MESNQTKTCVHIRWMIRRDMPAVLAIENKSFEFSWTEEDFIRCLRQRNCIGMVAEENDQVVGFMIYE
ncbi:ribosomal-protein-alanine N-acetyltransferase RimI, partial [Rubripirellula amarantea]|nr:ribosomal-protein-alanine N-acetyltransferase RimI [Rubripirellula amarantea]